MRAGRDAIVVGGGPSGAALAIGLAQHGYDVLLLDAARFPRDKICGEGISPEAWPRLEAIGAADRVRALQPQPLRGMRLVSPDGTAFCGRYGGGRAGFAVRRLSFDAALLAAARGHGVEVKEGLRVTELLREGDAVTGVIAAESFQPLPFTARVVCGADGRRSVVARRLGLLREHPTMRRFAVRGYWDAVQGLDEVGEMHVGDRGYCGIAPLAARRANVTFVLDVREMSPAAGDLEGFYRRSLVERWPRVAERLECARLLEPPRAIGPLALECRAVSARGVVLVGDAAGFYDPFTGEGVTLALRTAELAASAIAAALGSSPRGGTLERLDPYERARHAATRGKFRFNRLLQSAIAYPALANALARRLARRPDLADRLVGIAGDFVPARSALDLGFLADLLCA